MPGEKQVTPNHTTPLVNSLDDVAPLIAQCGPAVFELLQRVNLATTLDTVKRGVLHDIRNPLHTIVMAARAIGDEADDPALAVQLSPIIVDAVTKLESCVERLERTKSFVGKTVEPVVVKDIVLSVVELRPTSQRSFTPPIHVNLSDDLPPVWAVADQLEQAVLNLVLNAHEALIEQGSGEITIEGHSRDGTVTITVTDDGPGIPEAVVATATQPFVTTKKNLGHLGLGLAVTNYYLQNWGSSLELTGRENGSGTMSIISLRAVGADGDSRC